MTSAQQSYMDFDWNDFVEKVYSYPPQDPFTFFLEWLDDMEALKLSELLGNMLVKGCQQLYKKEIAQLNPDEIDTLQKYYRSLGYEVEFKIKTEHRYIEQLGKTMPVNLFAIDFKPCSQGLNTNNRPDAF